MSQSVLPSSSAADVSAESVEKLPGRITVSRELGALTIDWSWRNPATVLFLLFFCIVWDTIVFGAMFFGVLPVLFMITHGVSGIVVTYFLLTKLFNKTRIEVTHQRLRVRVRPLPWPGMRDVDESGAEQLFVKKTEKRSDNGTDTSTFSVAVQTKTSGFDLVKDLETVEQARTIESLIESYLNIKDYRVAGEFNEGA